jgi:glucose-1-phosphate thymidylyltransferase
MDALVLAGGFATRLRPLSEYIPKPLFPLGGVPILNYIVYKVEEEIKPKRLIISTNKRFDLHFRHWARSLDSEIRSKVEIVPEPTLRNEEKFGAIKGLYNAIKEAWVEDDLIVIAGDNFFDFDLRKVKRLMKEKKSIVLGLFDVKDFSEAKRFGVAEIDSNLRILSFEEKPENPKSTLISTGIYVIPKEKLSLLEEYLESSSDLDALGKFFEWLIKKEEVYGYPYKGVWFDIGTIEAYRKANEFVLEKGLFWRWI